MPIMEPEKKPMETIDETQPDHPSALESKAPSKTRAKPSVLRFIWLLIPLSILLAATGGYFTGVNQGEQERLETVGQTTDEQFQMAIEDLAAGRYDLARQRLEYISRLDPTYPGVAEKLAEALVALNAPTQAPSPVVTPTPNLAPIGEMFDQAQAAFDQEDWSLAMETLIALRAKEPTYRPIEVDRLLFLCLRNRGVHRIEQEGRLEEGIYDLSRAELFGPLDRDANNWREWARMYLLANSYMGVEWGKAAYHFSQLYLIAPYLKGDTYIKYAQAAQAYGDQLYNGSDSCAAQEQYQQSLNAWNNELLQPTATKAAKACMTATAPKPKPPQPTEETPTPGGEGDPTEPAPTPTPEDG